MVSCKFWVELELLSESRTRMEVIDNRGVSAQFYFSLQRQVGNNKVKDAGIELNAGSRGRDKVA